MTFGGILYNSWHLKIFTTTIEDRPQQTDRQKSEIEEKFMKIQFNIETDNTFVSLRFKVTVVKNGSQHKQNSAEEYKTDNKQRPIEK